MSKIHVGNVRGKSAYEQAVAGGYTGTEEQFEGLLVQAVDETIIAAEVVGDDLVVTTSGGVIRNLGRVTGLPGVNAVPTDEAVATYAATPGTATNTALSATVVGYLEAEENLAPLIEGAVDLAVDAADIPGQVAIELAAQAGKVLQGSGSPNGAVTATPGTLYVDTANTNGASIWRKNSGTGTSGWVVVSGDTGWRDMSANIINDWQFGSGGFIHFRRINNVVYLRIRNLDPVAASSDYFYSGIPSGFKNEINNIMLVCPTGVGATTAAFAALDLRRFEDDIRSSRSNGAIAPSSWASVTVDYLTADSWPTALPGNPV